MLLLAIPWYMGQTRKHSYQMAEYIRSDKCNKASIQVHYDVDMDLHCSTLSEDVFNKIDDVVDNY